jgi:hypothetical protein
VLADETQPYRLVQDSRHSGDLAKKVDATTTTTTTTADACRRAHTAGLERFEQLFGRRIQHYEYVSEEAGTRTNLLRPHTLITRCDPMDGTTNLLTTLMGFATAVTVDLVGAELKRARHLSGAIVGGGPVDISWSNLTTRSRIDGSNLQPTGQVFLRIPALGEDWHRLPGLRDDRSHNTLAAVATSAARLNQLTIHRERALSTAGGRFYSYAGNPIAAGLLLGVLGAVAEPNDTKLHDTVFLHPLTLFGGTIERLDDGNVIDYLSLYEQNAINLDAQATPIPPYLVHSGQTTQVLLADASQHRAGQLRSTPSEG